MLNAARTTTPDCSACPGCPSCIDPAAVAELEREYAAATLRQRLRAEARGERWSEGPDPDDVVARWAWLRERVEAFERAAEGGW